MSKQSANRHNRNRQAGQANGKSATNAAPKASSLPQTATKANGNGTTKSLETATKTTAAATTKPADTATTAKANMTVATKPVKPEPKSATSPAGKSGQTSAKAGAASMARQNTRQQRRTQKEQSRLEQQRIDTRNRRITLFSIAAAIVLVGSLIGYFVWQNNTPTSALSQAQTIVDANYGPVDGVYCSANEQLSYHIHAHLTIYVDGQTVPLSQFTGIAPIGLTTSSTPTCYYWMHTHDTSGVIHIESPTTKLYTLKQFFDIWEKFSSSSIIYPTQLSSSTGWTIYVNGKQVNTDFSHLQLTAHELVTIAYNSPGIKPDTTYSWGQL